jgi:hypothetical protein
MEKELSKKLLVWGSTLMVIQNIILIPSLILVQIGMYDKLWLLAFAPVFWIDLIGFGLIGAGMYFIGDFYTSVASFTRRTALVAFTWVFLAALWRLMCGILIPILIPFVVNNVIFLIIFGIAAAVFFLLMISINQVINTFQEQEGIGKGGSPLLTVYAIIHIIGAAVIVLGFISVLGQSASEPWYSSRYMTSVLLTSLGFLLKLIVVPIMGIGTFLRVRNRFQSIEDDRQLPHAEDKELGKCPVCGKLTKPNEEYCSFCGYNLGKN